MDAMIFEGGETLTEDVQTINVIEWNQTMIEIAFIHNLGEDWANEEIETDDGMIKLIDTVDIVNDRIAQCTTDYDGGMTYLVRM